MNRKFLFMLTFSITTAGLLSPVAGNGQSQEKIYAALLLNFARSIQWPSASQQGNFIIGVFEYPPLLAELKQTTLNMKAGTRKIEIRDLTHEDEASGCHVLFIPAYKAKVLPQIVAKNPADPTLIISNKLNMARQGSGINFVLVEGKLRYEINTKSIEARGLKIPSSVKNMGIQVE